MNRELYTELKEVAFLGDYVPRKCGIATFTRDLHHAVAHRFPSMRCQVVAVSDLGESYDYPPEVAFEIRDQRLSDYRRTAEYLGFKNVQCVCVQHEFGIYGGDAGAHLLAFLREAKFPVVTTCHTLLESPSESQRRVFEKLVALSQILVTMSERGRKILREVFEVPEEKIRVIPHGIPDTPFVDPAFFKDQFGVEGKKVLLTFGLLSPGKGIEYGIKAMPRIVADHPDAVYIILGATHPNLVREEGEAYRCGLQQLVKDLGVEGNVLFFNRFVSVEQLTEFIGACDVYLTPYLNPAQVTSGALAYAFGSGKAVVSTPYWHAEELLAEGRGRLVPFRDAEAIATEANALFADDVERARLRREAYLMGREMVWSRVAQMYVEVCREARRAYSFLPRLNLRGDLKPERLRLPKISLAHLRRMTDTTGIFQHAKFSFPDFAHGYCLDDNARALLFSIKYAELQAVGSKAEDLTMTYASFVNYAFDRASGRFRNFMSFDRNWLEEAGSDDSQGRALWALGECVARSRPRSLQNWATELFEEGLPRVLDTTSPRAWAFALIGLHSFLRRLSGNRYAQGARRELADRLGGLYDATAGGDWRWFETVLSYDNAKLAHAMILTGRELDDARFVALGLESLEWLMKEQSSDKGSFSPIGSEGFYRKEGGKALCDQQPLEAESSVSACLEAYRTTREDRWLEEASRAFRWFLGSNKLGLALYDHATGGCRDGLQVDRLNQNEGAESTLAYLLARIEIQRHERSLRSFLRPMASQPKLQHVAVPVA